MGQKINPLCFRLGTTESYHSLWFAQTKKDFPRGLQEDEKIRDCIKKYVQKMMKVTKYLTEIVRIQITKELDSIKVIVYFGFGNFLIKEEKEKYVFFDEILKQKQKEKEEFRIKELKELRTRIQNKINPVNQKLNIRIKKLEKPYEHPNFIAQSIAIQLKSRISPRMAMKNILENIQKEEYKDIYKDIKGIRIQIAGPIDGAERTRLECIRQGKLPLQTIRCKIDYCSYTIRTIYGILGIKIWIYVNREKIIL